MMPEAWSSDDRDFGRQVTAKREALQLDRPELARRADLTVWEVRNTEAGRCPSADVRGRLISVLVAPVGAP